MKLGYIGTSAITMECLEASRSCADIERYVLLSRSPRKGAELAERYGVSHVVNSVEALAQSYVEAVYIASPNALHYEQAKALLESGKHLLVEKPFTVTLRQTRELAALARARGLILLEAVIPVHCPNFYALKDYLPKIGSVQKAEFHFGKISSKWTAFQKGESVNIFTPEMGGGSLMDLGVYSVWMMAALLGKPQSCIHHAEILPTGVDGKGILRCTYPSFEAEIRHSKISDEGASLKIFGENGLLSSEGFSKMDSVSYVPCGGISQDLSLPQEKQRMIYELNHFTRHVIDKTPIPHCYGLEITEMVIDILEQARRSAGIILSGD